MNALSSRASALAVLAAAIGMGDVLVSGPSAGPRIEPMPKGRMPKRIRITAGPPSPNTDLRSLISVYPGGTHGKFLAYSPDGMIEVRKPFDADTINWTPEAQRQSAA